MYSSDVVQFEQAEPDNGTSELKSGLNPWVGSPEFVETGHEIIDLIPAFF